MIKVRKSASREERFGIPAPQTPSRAGVIPPHPLWTPTGRISPHYPTVTPKIWGSVIPTLSRLSYPAGPCSEVSPGWHWPRHRGQPVLYTVPEGGGTSREVELPGTRGIHPAHPAGDAGLIQDLLPTASIPAQPWGGGTTPNHPKIMGRGVTPAWMGDSRLG